MRLTENELFEIKTAFNASFKEMTLYLFGSRIDDTKKGGDIDLLILSNEKIPMRKLLPFESLLIRALGERKIDILNYKFDDKSPFLELILQSAVRL